MTHRLLALGGGMLGAAALMIGGASAASASTPTYHGSGGASTTGSSAYAYDAGSGYMGIYVCDTHADGDSPYTWWNSGSSTHQPTNRIEITSGNGTCSATTLVKTNELTFQACRDVPHYLDNCSGWVHVDRT